MYAVNVNTLCSRGWFQGFVAPHDVAVSPDGKTVYVGEIEPHSVWKFVVDRP